MNLPVPPTQAPRRGSPSTTGKVVDVETDEAVEVDQRVASNVTDEAAQVADFAVVVKNTGFSAPRGPWRRSFIAF